MNPHPAPNVENVLSRLHGVKPAGPCKWSAYCPAHENPPDGHSPSLSIARGHNGGVVLHCFGGCDNEKIVRALHMTIADLFPPKTNPPPRAKRRAATGRPPVPPEKPRTIYPTLDAGIQAMAHVGKFAWERAYPGPHDFHVARFNLPTIDAETGKCKKVFLPFHKNGKGFVCADPPGKLPLYRGDDLPADGPIIVTEGELKADAARSIGLAAVTSSHGCESARRSDWTPLGGREIIILADNDPGGLRYAQEVAAILTALGAVIRIVCLPGLPPKGDICDWLSPGGPMDAKTGEECRDAILALADAAPVFDPAQAHADEAPEAEESRPVLVCLADVEPEPLRWLWPGRIPLGKVALNFGDPGLGKTFVTLDMAARVSRGMAWPDAPGKPSVPGGVVILTAEDDLSDTVRPRLDAAGADVRRIVALQGVEYARGGRGYFNLACDLPALEAAIRQTPDTRLVILDPVSAFLGGTDSHKNAEIRGLLAPLADLAARYDVAVLTVTHMSKGIAGRALYRAMGSLGFIAAARAAWLTIADADDPKRRLFLPAKMNLAEEPSGLAYRLVPVMLDKIGPVGRVEWESGAVNLTADAALAAAAADPEARATRDQAAEWLRAALADGPKQTAELQEEAREAGIAWATIRRAQAAVGIKPRRQGFGPDGAWYWTLPEGTHGPLP